MINHGLDERYLNIRFSTFVSVVQSERCAQMLSSVFTLRSKPSQLQFVRCTKHNALHSIPSESIFECICEEQVFPSQNIKAL